MTTDKIARERHRALLRLLGERDRRYSERFEAQEGANRLALDAAKEAVLTAASAYEKRFDSVNEFRKTLTDQAALFMPRAEVEALLKSVNSTLNRLENQAAAVSGRGLGMGQLWGYLAGAAGLVIAAIALFRH